MFRMTYDRQNEKQQSYIINYIVAYGQCIHVISNFWSDELTNILKEKKKDIHLVLMYEYSSVFYDETNNHILICCWEIILN